MLKRLFCLKQLRFSTKSDVMKFPVIEFPISAFTQNFQHPANAIPTSITSEASDMENRHLQYLDAYNRGFIVDFGSGRKVTFCLTATETDGEGDITSWRYRSNEGITATVFND